MKKAGLVVGLLMVVISVVIYFIAKGVGNMNEQGTQAGTQTTTKAVVTTTPVAVTTPAPESVTQPPIVIQPPETQVVITTTASTSAPVDKEQSFVVIEPTTLSKYVDSTVKGTVSGKSVYYYNTQLIYSLSITTAEYGTLEYFTTAKNYEMTVGTQVIVTLRSYVKSSGSKIPSILQVTLA